MATQLAPVKSAKRSKINWTQIIGIAGMVGSYFGFDLTPEEHSALLLSIGVVTKLVTMIWRTWFNDTVTP